jgi:hypothetical protein
MNGARQRAAKKLHFIHASTEPRLLHLHLSPIARQQQSITGSAFLAGEKETDYPPLVLPVIATLCPASVHLDVMIPQSFVLMMRPFGASPPFKI